MFLFPQPSTRNRISTYRNHGF